MWVSLSIVLDAQGVSMTACTAHVHALLSVILLVCLVRLLAQAQPPLQAGAGGCLLQNGACREPGARTGARCPGEVGRGWWGLSVPQGSAGACSSAPRAHRQARAGGSKGKRPDGSWHVEAKGSCPASRPGSLQDAAPPSPFRP